LFAAPAVTPSVDGETNKVCHELRDGKTFPRLAASAKHDIVIVGGGNSGLTAAYLLRDKDFLLLEKETHWGGNATLAEYQGAVYGTGAAFLEGPEDAGYVLAKELGLEPLPIDNWDGTIVNGEFVPDTWGDGLDKLPYSKELKVFFERYRTNMLNIDAQKRAAELESTPWLSYMRGYPQEIRQWWDNYGPSNWGGASEHTAASIGLGTLREIAGPDRHDLRATFPGGLGAISKRLAEKLEAEHKDRMRNGVTIVSVQETKSEALVTYVEGSEVKTVSAKAVIMATPKQITRRLVEGLPDKQDDAMRQLHYIPYAVVNLIYDKPVFNKGYDTWCPGNRFTDVIVADWVIRNQPGYQQKYNILTCYTPLKEGERSLLLTEDSARKVAGEVLRDFQKLLPTTNVDPLEVHIYRRGHPLYQSRAAVYTDLQPLTRQPMDRIFFANTDSEGPVSSTGEAVVAARRSVKEVEKRLAANLKPRMVVTEAPA
jgi:protoporphyrinogen oxidase